MFLQRYEEDSINPINNVMEVLVFFLIGFVLFCLIFFGIQRQKELEENSTPNSVSSINNNENSSNEDWIYKHKMSIIEEQEKIDNGGYESYRYIDFNVAGIKYRSKSAQESIDELDLISDIQFVKEPTNFHDPYAVQVMYFDEMIGYVPREYSSKVTMLIDQNLIYKIFVLEAGDDILTDYEEKFVTLRVYYKLTQEELAVENARLKHKQEKKEIEEQKEQESIELPDWVEGILFQLKNTQITNDDEKWVFKRLRENIRNSVKAYEKAMRMERVSIAQNALDRLKRYGDDLEQLIKK